MSAVYAEAYPSLSEYGEIIFEAMVVTEKYFLHTRKGHLRFYSGLENLILPMLSLEG